MLDDDDLLIFQTMSSSTNFDCGIYFTFSMPSIASMYLSMISCLENNCDSFEHHYCFENTLILSIRFTVRLSIVEVFIYSF